MRIYIRDIKFDGLNVRGEIPSDFIGTREDDDFRFSGPIKAQCFIEKADNTVVVEAKTTGTYESFCALCLEPVKQKWNQAFTFDFEVDKDAEFIDLDEEIRQEMILRFPYRIVCREDCKGICPDCGMNLNTEQCQCVQGKSKPISMEKKETQKTYRPFEGLKDLPEN